MRRASGCSFAILQSPRPLWSFEHSGPMTLCACVDAWCLRVAPHASGESTLMWLNAGSSRIYVRTKLHWWGVNAETCMYADGITLLHLGVVEHSVRGASGCSFAILQSPRPLWLFEHSGPMTLCACVDAWCLRVAPHASGESTLMWLNAGSSRIYVRTKLHWWGVNAETCMYADGIYIYIYIYN